MNLRIFGLIAAFALAGLLVAEAANAQVTIMTSRPDGSGGIDWRQINVIPNSPFPTPLAFESFDGIGGKVGQKGDLLSLFRQCCCANDGIYDGNFNRGDYLIVSSGTPAQIILGFAAPVKSVGAQIATDSYGPYVAKIQAFRNKQLLGTFTENGNLTGQADGSAIFLGVQDTNAEITDVVFTATINGSPTKVVINRVSVSQ